MLSLVHLWQEWSISCCVVKALGYLTNVYTGRLHPKVQPFTLLYTIFREKGTPFVYLLLTV